MASVASGIVTNNLAGDLLNFTDTGTYTAPIVSRSLQINDYQGNPLATINMGASLTANYPITADGYYIFILSVTDATGVVPPATINYLAIGFYTLAYDAIILPVACSCNCSEQTFKSLSHGELMLIGAQRSGIGQNAVNAQNQVIAANNLL